MNKEIEKTLMNGDYESAYRLIQEYRSQKYDYDTFSYLSYYYTLDSRKRDEDTTSRIAANP